MAERRTRELDQTRRGGVEEVLALQRSVGNAVVSQRLAREAAPTPSVQRQATIQRNGESAALLQELATPRVAEGPAIEVQKSLVAGLERLARETWGDGHAIRSELNLGGVLILHLPQMPSYLNEGSKERTGALHDALVQDVPQSGPAARFVTLEGTNTRSTGIKFGHVVAQNNLGALVVENALKTMIDAKQVEYLRLAGLPNAQWKILVELHYIRSRPKDMAGFHKDTQGQSLFVNLNYHVEGHDVRGPEYITNPPRSEAHDQLTGVGGGNGTLPPEFGADLTAIRQSLPSPTRIESSPTVTEFGYVAFVDEAIHHATPWFGNRYITPAEFRAHLERHHGAKFAEAVRAKKEYDASRYPSLLYPAHSYVKTDIIGPQEAVTWMTWLAMATDAGRKTRYTRDDFTHTMPGTAFDDMLEDIGGQAGAERSSAGSGGWHSASIPNPGGRSILAPVRPEGGRHLVRTASSKDLTKNMPAQLPDDVDRRFIRTWVRAVPADFAANL
ncbi:hypothetical protein [Kribbia dieselivorans]|uniref:hypothetical protein n=1 Tax=Kribbia dieselivorans TaxID=331526 RepID=UPI0008380736|nr:hypothetical protein [Kribbia dieselivorans]